MLHTFNELRNKLETYLEKEHIDIIYDAYVFAANAHKDQLRVSGEPYIYHPLAVCCILADLKLDYQSIAAALLHDVLEDTEIEKTELAEKYGEIVAELVDGVSKLKQLNFSTKAEAQAENLRKMMLAMVRDIRVIIIKMADRLHNMQTLGVLKPNKRRRIARETLEIYAPIANRLGMHYFKTEFETLGFEHLHPMRARILREELRRDRGSKKELINKIEEDIKTKLDKFSIKNHKIIGREKNIYSIYKKMKLKNIPFREIMDIYAFRIEVDSIDDCYRVLGIVHSLFKPVSAKFKDFVAIPKINGYQALHTVLRGPRGIPIEIQIRSHEMSRLAENGVAAHWLYKESDVSISTAQKRAREWFASLMEMQKRAGDSLEFIENVKIDLFPDEVYVFTPGGDIIKLKKGSTAVDLAYAVHTDIGNTCVATRIDHRLSPLSTVLENGQTIEIITAFGARPNPVWLNFVQTGKARSSIRHFLKMQKDLDMHSLGKKLLDTALSNIDINLEKVGQQIIDRILSEYDLPSIEQLYQEIGIGARPAYVVVGRLSELLKVDLSQIDKNNIDKTPIVIKGTEGMAIHFAECCYPIPGDAIVGTFVENKGLIVHQENCKKLAIYENYDTNLHNMQVCWEEDIKGLFNVEIAIDVVNQRGMLAELAVAISLYKANIERITTEDKDGGQYTLINMLLGVRDHQHLTGVLRNLRKIKNVNKVYRTDQLN
jgi:guanosine-3',5'-bis(diphosphate) 3'-pyrophosphohydrolase